MKKNKLETIKNIAVLISAISFIFFLAIAGPISVSILKKTDETLTNIEDMRKQADMLLKETDDLLQQANTIIGSLDEDSVSKLNETLDSFNQTAIYLQEMIAFYEQLENDASAFGEKIENGKQAVSDRLENGKNAIDEWFRSITGGEN